MLNKRVEELVRIENAARNEDKVRVEFLYSQGYYAVYKVVTSITGGYCINIREQLIVEKQGKIVSITEVAYWNDHEGRPEIDDSVWYNTPEHLIYEASFK